jgi:chemotaxis response regulator CheB
MNPSFMRVLLAIDTDQQATFFEQYLADAGHEIVAVEARGDLALKAARLVHPDVVIINGPLRGPIDSSGLTAALKANREAPVPVLFVTDPAELPALLEQQAYYLSSPTPDAASNAA